MTCVRNVVVGGGVMGCAIAYHLSRAGEDVVLLERGELNREASGANAGTIHLQIRQHENRGRGRLSLIERSAEEWRALEGELEKDIGLRMHGGLMLAHSEDEVNRLQQKMELDASLGLEPEFLTGAELLQLERALSPRIAAAVRSPHEGSANPLLVTEAFAARARDYGAVIKTHTAVTSLSMPEAGRFLVGTTDGALLEAERVVSAAGAWTGSVSRLLGIELPVWGYPLSVSVTEALPPLLSHVVQHIGRKLTMKQTAYGTVLLGGGWLGTDEGVVPKEATFEGIAGNAWEAIDVLPALASARLLRSWAGTIAVTADALPIVGEDPRAPGFVVVVVPVGAAGYTVGPAVARIAANAVTTGVWPEEWAEYRPDRVALKPPWPAGSLVDCRQPTGGGDDG